MLYFSRQSIPSILSPLLYIYTYLHRWSKGRIDAKYLGKKLIIRDFKNIRRIISLIFESTVLRIVRINITARSVACASKNNSFVNLLAVDHCQPAGVSAFPPPRVPGPGQFRGSTRFLAVTPERGTARDVRRRSIVKGNAFRTIDRANEPLPFPDRVYDLWRTNQLQFNRGCIPSRRRNLWRRDHDLSVFLFLSWKTFRSRKNIEYFDVSFFFITLLLLDCTLNHMFIIIWRNSFAVWVLKYRNK